MLEHAPAVFDLAPGEREGARPAVEGWQCA